MRVLLIAPVLLAVACAVSDDAGHPHDALLNEFPPLERQSYVANYPMDCREGGGETVCRTCTVMALGAAHGLAVDAELYAHTLRRDEAGAMTNAISAPLDREDFSHDASPESVRASIDLAHAWCADRGAVRLSVLKDELDAAFDGGDE